MFKKDVRINPEPDSEGMTKVAFYGWALAPNRRASPTHAPQFQIFSPKTKKWNEIMTIIKKHL